MKVSIIGLGYIGLPTAILLAKSGNQVLGVDINEDYLLKINNNKIISKEQNLNKYLREVINNKSLKTEKNIEQSDVFVIVVPTPIDNEKIPDTTFVNDVIIHLVPKLEAGNLVIIESTCPVGTTKKVSDILFQKRPDLKDELYLAYCPERVIPGNIFSELIENDRIVGGINLDSSKKAKSFYQTFIKGEIHLTDSNTAELCKLTENASRDAQIAFANELSIISEKVNVNPWELIDLANKHPRVNILNPGIGVGGHCIAVDPWFLVSDFPKESNLIATVRRTNINKTLWCLNKTLEVIESFKTEHKRSPIIACMGLSYKPDVDDLRESPAVYIAKKILEKNNINTLIVEPNIFKHELFIISSINDAIISADIIVWLVFHKEFRDLKIEKNKIQVDFIGFNKKYN